MWLFDKLITQRHKYEDLTATVQKVNEVKIKFMLICPEGN